MKVGVIAKGRESVLRMMFSKTLIRFAAVGDAQLRAAVGDARWRTEARADELCSVVRYYDC